MEYGFAGFCNEKDKLLSALLRESNNIDYLGLRKMNVRLSNILFPFANTLMPNLVYFYYLHAIYYAVMGEANENDGQKAANSKPSKEEVERINNLEKVISEAIRVLPAAKGKGFFGDVKSRAYEKYKNSMRLLHFFDEEWIPYFNENQSKIWKNERESLHGYLSQTDRYKFVYELNQKDKEDEQKAFINEKINENWLCKLDDVEKRDFVWRVIDPYGIDKGTISPYSLFSNIIMYCCNLKNKPGDCSAKIYKVKDKDKDYNYFTSVIKNDEKYKEEHKEENKEVNKEVNKEERKGKIYNKKFDELVGYISNIQKGVEGNAYSSVNQLPVYEVAVVYSKLQLIAKLAYNMCLFDRNDENSQPYKKYKAGLREQIKAYATKYCEKRCVIDPEKKADYSKVFFNDGDEGLKDIFRFIAAVDEKIRSNNDVDNNIEEIIGEIIELVKDRERSVLGGNSRLDSGMAFEAMGDYEDTFRWEYRPELEMEAAKDAGIESENADSGKLKNENADPEKLEVEDTEHEKSKVGNAESGNKGDVSNGPHNMCASYYIYELFYEK